MDKKIILISIVLFMIIVGGIFLYYPKTTSDSKNTGNNIEAAQKLTLKISNSEFTSTKHSFLKSSPIQVEVINKDDVDHSFELKYYDEEKEEIVDIVKTRLKANESYKFALDSKLYKVLIYGCTLKCPVGGQIEGLIGFYE